MTISPSLNSQFNVLVNLAVVTNIIPYILSMAALVIIQKVANVPPSKAKVANLPHDSCLHCPYVSVKMKNY